MMMAQQKNYLELVQNTFSTIILDAIQYFPENVKKVHSESSGLLFGLDKGEYVECDYIFPVGSVAKRTKNSVQTNPKVEAALKASRQLFSTSNFIGTYHSHPYEEYFSDWACPSNGDILYSLTNKYPFEIIIAITRDGKENKPLTINIYENDGLEFLNNESSDPHSSPKTKKLGYQTSYIVGEFQKYKFEIRAYQYTGNSLKDIDLESSEVALFSLLDEENIKLANLPEEDTYSLRKMEFNLRTEQDHPKSDENIKYHLNKLKKSYI
jgi:proteasome lid subunit RPN8/RPN11